MLQFYIQKGGNMGILLNVEPVSKFVMNNKEFVIFDADEYEREMQAERLLANIAEGERQIANGQYMTPEQLKEKMMLWKKEQKYI